MIKKFKSIKILTVIVLFLVLMLGASFFLYAKTDASSSSASNMLDLWENEKFCTITAGETVPYYADFSKVPKKAIKVVAAGHNATVKFKNVVNISDLKKEDAFIDIFVAPAVLGSPGSKRYTQDFGKIKITITDAEDETNYVEMLCQRNQAGAGAFFQAGTDDVSLGGRATTSGINKIWDAHRGTQEAELGAFYGQSKGDLNENVSPIQFRFDNQNKEVWFVRPNGKFRSEPVRKLGHEDDMGSGFEWEGFTSGRVTISISALDFYNATGTYYITSFLGLDVTQTNISDVNSPILQTEADAHPEILTGVIGRKYPMFNSNADDMISGVLSVKQEITMPGATSAQPVTDGYYIPSTVGEHLLRYYAEDASGNKSEKFYTLNVVTVHPKISISLEDNLPTTARVGEKLFLPKAVTTGGIYSINTVIEVEHQQKGYTQIVDDGCFIPDMAGVYSVKYKATDFLGGTEILEREIVVDRSESPIYEAPVLPSVFIAGKTYELPKMTSWDYINNPSYKQEAVVEVYESKTEVVGDDFGTKIENLSSYTPAFSSDEITQENVYITYVTYCEGYESQKLSYTYEIKLVQVKQMYDLFNMKNVTPTLTDSYIKFTPECEGASMSYSMPISARQSEITFEIQKTENNFNRLRITLTDSENANQQVQLDIVKNLGSHKSYVFVHGVRYSMNGSFDETPPAKNEPVVQFKIKFAEDMNSISDALSTLICNFKTYLDGTPFNGFSSGRFYVNFEFIGVSGASSINLKNIGVNQPVKGFVTSGEFVDFFDTGKPYIYISGKLSQVGIAQQPVNAPAAFAYDVIDFKVNCFVQVLKTANNKTTTIVESMPAENGVTFIPDDFGIYTIKYFAQDSTGNSSQRTLYVYVDDNVSPTIVVDGYYDDTYEVGEEITIINAISQDLQGGTVMNIFITSPNGDTTIVKPEDVVKLEKKGLYIIKYCAYDSNYNYSVVSFQINVK